jgi:glycosyltransferase involved in cell wall biosynthesis
VLERLAGSTGLIFASSLESFGLPLLEARALGVPVLAAERDFVREVCEPQQTFDPASPHSIADAVRRFLAPGFRRELPVLSARDVARMLAE